ncbi:ABC transporter A family member 1 [Cyclospora cayetanensis]|uniref:ABC transporter A family member 1 n=1 Tax=Cyclospora cayetanensis TaxID=88456 RepID=A0A6P6RSS3_9EIME|nr:ABC transporter A family member 1 [Cyclospora cayetanensis]
MSAESPDIASASTAPVPPAPAGGESPTPSIQLSQWNPELSEGVAPFLYLNQPLPQSAPRLGPSRGRQGPSELPHHSNMPPSSIGADRHGHRDCNGGSIAYVCERGPVEMPVNSSAWAREISGNLSHTSFKYTQYPNLLPMSTEHRLDFAKRSLPFPRRMYSHVSETTDRVCVLLWRAFALKLRYPLMTLIGIVAPVALVVSACKILSHYQNIEVNFLPANMSVDPFSRCNFGAYTNRTTKTRRGSDPCFSPSNLMPPFGRRYDGLHLMYLPAILHSGGYLAFVDKAGSDCQQLRKFLGEFAQTVSPYLMERTLESQLFITFPSERALEKYRREAAAYKKRPIYSAFICRAAAPGGLDITIRMHVRRGTPRSIANHTIRPFHRYYTGYDSMTYFGGTNFLLKADTIGTEAQDKPYGHLTGGFLDLLTLVHTFNLDRTGVRKLFPGSIVPQQQKPQWLRISETFYKIFDYFGRIPVLNSIMYSRNSIKLLRMLLGQAEKHLSEILALVLCISASSNEDQPQDVRYLLPAFLAGPGYGAVRLYTHRAVQAGCDSEAPAMKVLESLFYSRTKKMGAGLILATGGPLHQVLRTFSSPVRTAYAPVMFMESGMPFTPATVTSRFGKPDSCCAPFVVLFVCILWQAVKAIMVDKETGFKNMLKILGISDKVLWLSWYIFFIIYSLPMLLLVAFVSKCYAFTLSDIWFLLTLLVLALMATISFALFVTAFFTDGNLAAMAACAWCTLIWAPVVCQWLGNEAWSPSVQRFFMASCPVAALGVGIDIAWLFNEPYTGGIRSSTANLPALGVTIVDVYATLSISTAVFFLFGAYLHKILPNSPLDGFCWLLESFFAAASNGCPEHPLFLLIRLNSWARQCCNACGRLLACPWSSCPRDSLGFCSSLKNAPCLAKYSAKNKDTPLLDVRGVCKTFSTWQAKKCSRGSLQAVNRVSFSVYRDEIFGVLGQNGAGKSTLISVITGSIAFTDGDVFIEGLSMKRQPTYARRNIGYCPQFDVLLPYLTVEETLWVYASLRGVPRSHRKEEIAELMNMMKLSEMAKVRIEALSGGWRRRVSSTVAFLGDPAVVFLDEPTAGMDTLYRRTFWDSVRCLSRSRCIVLTTHMMEEADYLCDRLAIMVDGRIASAGAPLILKTRFGRGYIISVISRKQGHREEQQAKKKLRQLLHTLEHPPAIQEISGHELRIFSPFHHSFQLPVYAYKAFLLAFISLCPCAPRTGPRTENTQPSFAFKTRVALSELFAELEKNGEQYGVESAVLGFGSLEEVFLNVVKLARQEQERAAHSLGLVETTNPDGESLENAANTRESACSSPSCAIEPGSPLGFTEPDKIICIADKFGQMARNGLSWAAPESGTSFHGSRRNTVHVTALSLRGSALLATKEKCEGLFRDASIMGALLKKRVRFLCRGLDVDAATIVACADWVHVTISFFIPLMLMGLTLYMRAEKSEPRVPLNGQQLLAYRLSKPIHAEVPYGGEGWVLGTLDNCNSPAMTHNNVSDKVKNNNEMYDFLLDGYTGPHLPRYGAYVVRGRQPDISDTANQLEVTLWHNATLRDAVPLHYSHLLNCIAQDRRGLPNSVFVSNQPFADTEDKFMDALIVAFFTIIAYSFVAAGIGKACIVERVRRVRHQQILFGVTPFHYWASSYLVDMILLLLPCFIIFGMIMWANITPLVGQHQRGIFLLGTILFCLSVCPFGYAISMGLDSPMTFVIVMLILGWSLPSLQVLFTEVSGLQGIYSKYLRYFLMFLPHAALCELLINLGMMNQLASGTMKAEELVNWMDFHKTGCPLLYLGLTVLLNWTVCISVDWITNYPMGKPRLARALPSIGTLFKHLAGLLHCQLCEGAPQTCSQACRVPEDVPKSTGQFTRRMSPTDEGYAFQGRVADISCNIKAAGFTVQLIGEPPLSSSMFQDEEARAARAVSRLRQRSKRDGFASSTVPQIIKNINSKRFPRGHCSAIDSPVGDQEELDIPLVVYRLKKTYRAPFLQRFFSFCCLPFRKRTGHPLCCCCKLAQATQALQGVSFCVPKGKCLAYIGVNGSGKSTTFNILSSLVCQSDGSVFISGWDTLIHPQKARTKLRYCPQTDPLLPTLTGAEHVYLYGSLLGLRGRELAQFCSDFFDVIGCKQYMHRLVNSYSGGTKRKLSLGIAMLGDAELLLLDEPTCGVDPESRQALWRMIEDAKNCKTAGKAIILTSHSMEECEVLSDKVGILHRGKLLCLGTSAELRAAYGHGYQIECVFVAADVAENPALPQCFVAALKKNLPTLRLVHRMAYKITVSIAKKEASLAAIFREIDTAKAAFALEAYAVSETTLEEVFVEVSHQADQNDNQA